MHSDMDNQGKPDHIDMQILRTLQTNARLTIKEISARVSLSSTPVFERLRRLEAAGYIRKYTAVLDAQKLGAGFVVFCQVKLKSINGQLAADFATKVKEIPEVTECYNISGSFDYLLKVHAHDMNQYREFLLDRLGAIDGVGTIESIFVMDEIKNEYGITL